MLGAGYFGTGYFGAGYFGGASVAVPPPASVEEPVHPIATRPIAAVEEPVAPAAEDLLRLNNSAVIDYVYLVELRPFAPAGTSLPT